MIVGLSGRIHSGKDSVGAVLVKELGFTRVGFADGVRDKVIETYGFDREWVYSDDFKEDPCVLQVKALDSSPIEVSGRQLLQAEGMASRKIFGDDCWIKVAMAKCSTACRTCGQEKQRAIHHGACGYATCTTGYLAQHYVITDCRFGEWPAPLGNELAAIKAAGGKIIRLNRAESTATRHDFESNDGVISDRCIHWFDMSVYADRASIMSGPPQCGLPASAHPASWSADRHESETSLPDESPDYDAALTGDMETNTANAVKIVKGWLV